MCNCTSLLVSLMIYYSFVVFKASKKGLRMAGCAVCKVIISERKYSAVLSCTLQMSCDLKTTHTIRQCSYFICRPVAYTVSFVLDDNDETLTTLSFSFTDGRLELFGCRLKGLKADLRIVNLNALVNYFS